MELNLGPTGMTYNSALPHLVIPEYGRNVHRMIEHAVSIEDREERNRCARAIIDVMGQLNPQLRDVTDFKHKLWDHLFVISDFKLDVDSPYPIPSPESFKTKPNRVPYPGNHIRFRHYGRIVQDMIKKGIEMEEGDLKNAFVEALANLMKRFYVAWNRDAVSDEVIFKQLDILSEGKLKVREGVRLNFVQDGQRTAINVPPARRKKNRNNRRKY
jgi:hypothetical protein